MDGNAIPAFDALGDYRDSAARLLACRSNLYRAAEAAAAQATLDTVAQAIEDFRFLEVTWTAPARAGSVGITVGGEPAPARSRRQRPLCGIWQLSPGGNRGAHARALARG